MKSKNLLTRDKVEPKGAGWGLPLILLLGSVLIIVNEGQLLLRSSVFGNWFMLAWGVLLFATAIWLLVKASHNSK